MSLLQKIKAAALELAFVTAADAALAVFIGPGTFARAYYGAKGGGGGGFGGFFGGGGGGGGGGAKPPSGFGASGRYAPRAHGGGVVGRLPGRSGEWVAGDLSAVPRLHDGGVVGGQLAGDERLIVGQTGERVLNRREAAAYASAERGGGGGGRRAISVNIVNNGAAVRSGGATVEEDESGVFLSLVIDSMVDGKLGRATQSRFGLQDSAA